MPALHRVVINGEQLVDWEAFHTIFAEKLGFPSYYGRNLDAWHDCFYSLAEESTALSLSPGDLILLEVAGFENLQSRQPEIANFIIEGSAFVNFILGEADAEGPYGHLGAVAVSGYR